MTLLIEATLLEALTELEEKYSAPLPSGLRLDQMLDMAIERMNAAKRALGLVNKLEPGETRARHASRVMSNLNTLRAQVNRLFDEIDSQLQ